jgi:S-layer protein
MATYTEALQKLYVAYFTRPADVRGLAYWEAIVEAAGGNTAAVSAAFAASAEYKATYANMSNLQIVNKVYNNLFGHDADLPGLNYWVDLLDAKAITIDNVVKAIAEGALTTDLTAYNNKVTAATQFTTAMDTTAEVLAYETTLGQTAGKNFVTSVTTDATLATATGNLPTTLSAMVTETTPVPTPMNFTLTTGVDTFTGGAGADVFAATVTAASNPIGGLDALTGGEGVDALKIADTSVAAAADFNLVTGLAVSGIENLTVITNGALGTNGGTSFDISGFAGLTNASLTAVGAGTAGGSKIKAAGTTDVTLLVTGANDGEVVGGKAVSITTGTGDVNASGSALTSVTVNGGDVGTINNHSAGGTANAGTTMTTLTLDGVTGAASAAGGRALTTVNLANIGQAHTLTITNATASHTLNVGVTDTGWDATTGAAVTSAVVDAAATKVAITATGDSNLDVTAGVATSVTVAGEGYLDLDLTSAAAVTSIDASANSGGVDFSGVAAGAISVKGSAARDTITTTQTAKVTFDMGAGNDDVTIGTLIAAGSTINLGAGNDKLLKGAGSVDVSTATAVTVVDGGAGTDSIGAALINAANAGQFKNFEGIDLSGATATALDVELMTGSTITALTLSGGTGGSTVTNVAAGVGLSIDGANTGTSTIALKSTSASTDAFTHTFAGQAQSSAPGAANITAGTVVTNGIEALTIVSGGGTNTWNSIAVTDDRLKTVTISGAKNLDLTFVGTNGTNSSGVGAVTLIDGSAATGRLNINTTNVTQSGAGFTVKGGSANDTITLTGAATVEAGAGNDTITSAAAGGTFTGGAGTDNFVVTAAVATGTTAATSVLTTITDFSSTDKISFGAGATTFGATKLTLGAGVTNLDLALAAGVTAANSVNWFQYGGSTYIVADVNGSNTFNAGDVVVKLTGTVDLSLATLAANALTAA